MNSYIDDIYSKNNKEKEDISKLISSRMSVDYTYFLKIGLEESELRPIALWCKGNSPSNELLQDAIRVIHSHRISDRDISDESGAIAMISQVAMLNSYSFLLWHEWDFLRNLVSNFFEAIDIASQYYCTDHNFLEEKILSSDIYLEERRVIEGYKAFVENEIILSRTISDNLKLPPLLERYMM